MCHRVCHGTASDTYRSALLVVRSRAMMTGFSRPKIEEDVDLLGHKRGGCAAVGCKQFVQRLPTGWNDAEALKCSACDRLATDHALVQAYEPPPVAKKPSLRAPPQLPRRAAPPRHTFIEGELTAEKDPLSANSGPPPTRAEAPRQVVAEDETAAPAVSAPSAATEAQAAVEALLQREKDYNESFKAEVDRLIRAKRHEEVEAELRMQGYSPMPNAAVVPIALPPPPPPAPTVARFDSAAALLRAAALTQYVAAFEREELDPQTLLDVLTTKGRATLDAALKEATGAPMGHRMKIMTVLERGGGGEGLEVD